VSGARRLLCRHGVNSRGRNVNRTFYLDLFLSLRHVSAQSFRSSRCSSVILELQNFAVDIRAIIDSGSCLTMFFEHSTVTSDPLTSDPVYMSCKGHVGSTAVCQVNLCWLVATFYSALQCLHCKCCASYSNSVRLSVCHTRAL